MEHVDLFKDYVNEFASGSRAYEKPVKVRYTAECTYSCLHACILTCVHAYMHVRTCLHAYVFYSARISLLYDIPCHDTIANNTHLHAQMKKILTHGFVHMHELALFVRRIKLTSRKSPIFACSQRKT